MRRLANRHCIQIQPFQRHRLSTSPVPLAPVQLSRSPKQIELKSLNLDASKRFVVWWYGAICRSKRENQVPRVVVSFRQLHDNLTLGNFYSSTVALTSLGQLRIGSVWENKHSRYQIRYERKEFVVNFSEDQWIKTSSSAQHREKTREELIPQKAYPLRFGAGDRSKLLSLAHSKGTLLIPCIEFLRCYGRNQEVNRVLTTYDWDEVVKRLRLDEPVTPIPGARAVDLPWFATDSDAHLLAHLRYDTFTQRKLRGIHSEIENELGSPSSGHEYAFPTIGPWFTGSARLEVEGLEIKPGVFLGLRITAYTVPSKPEIHTLRTEFPEVGDEGYSGKPHPPRHRKELEEGEVASIGDDLSPDQDSNLIVIADPTIRILEAAPVTKLTTDKSVPRGSPGSAPKPTDISAPGEAGGSGKGVGLAHFVSETALESEGALRDLWNGLRHLRSKNPEVLKVLGWYSSDGTVSESTDQEPMLLSLQFSEGKENKKSLSASAKKWVYMYPDEPTRPRGVLVIEVDSPQAHGYLFEVQRRKISSKDSDDEDKEENYCGLAVKPPAGQSPNSWIPEVLFQIAEAKGIMGSALAHLPAFDGKDYRRSSSNSDEVAGQSTATNALKKLGIKTPRHKLKNRDPAKR